VLLLAVLLLPLLLWSAMLCCLYLLNASCPANTINACRQPFSPPKGNMALCRGGALTASPPVASHAACR
jgi:hypothetical protein